METVWNMNYGFLEAYMRGLRSTFLTDADYSHLRDCRRIEGVHPQPDPSARAKRSNAALP